MIFLENQYGINWKSATDIIDTLPKDSVFSTRYYTTQKIIEMPIWRFTSCTGAQVYYAEGHPMWGYSMTGMFYLMHDVDRKNAFSEDDPFTGNSVVFLKDYKMYL